MKVLFVANKYFSRYKYSTTSFEFVEKYSIVKSKKSWDNICKFTDILISVQICVCFLARNKHICLDF